MPADVADVAIVVPLYNAAPFIAATIESVLAQTFTSWELTVVDDGSTDGSADIVRRFAAADRRIHLDSGPNRGVAGARNRGLAVSDLRTRYVIFLDHDDLWLPDALETLVGVLERHDEYVSAHGLARSVDESGRRLAKDDLFERLRDRRAYVDGGVVDLGSDAPTTFAAVAVHNWIVTPGVHLIRRTVLERIGGFDPATVPADDWDLAVRVARCGDIGFEERQVLWWRRHDAAYSQTSKRWRLGRYRALDKLLGDPTNTPEQRRAAQWGYRRATNAYWRSALHALRHLRPVGVGKSVVRGLQGELRYVRANSPRRSDPVGSPPRVVDGRPAAQGRGSAEVG